MILVLIVALGALTVPLAHGHIMRLANLRFRRSWLLVVAVLLQIGLALVSGPRDVSRDLVHVVSYFFAVGFLVANRRIPGMWLIALGTSLNLVAIISNGGVMPASAHALATAGLSASSPLIHFSNSMALPSPKVSFLGDIFAIPRSLPLSNVFSVGDVCVAAGAVITLHRVSGSSLIPSGRGQFAPLLRQPTFMRLWASQAVSNLGDWTYALALAYTLVHRTHNPSSFALLLICQVAPAAVFGGLLGGLADRHSRIRLMIGADLIRALAVGSLLLGHPDIAHIYLVASVLGVCGAVFQPSLQASIPNVVASDQVVAANAMVGATYHFAIMAGPALGGLLVASFGAIPMFALNALSFVVSASLIAGIRLPRPARAESRNRSALKDLREGARYAMNTPLVRDLLIVIGLVLVAAASRAPLESLFILNTLNLGPEALGLVLGCWGLGMLLGSIAAPAVCRRWMRERVLTMGILVVGACVLLASQAHDLETVLLAWLLAGASNSVSNVAYESVLQERTPDKYRGRVFAAFGVVTNAAFLTGAFLAGWLGSISVRASYVFSGAVFIAGAAVAGILLWNSRTGAAVEDHAEGLGRPLPDRENGAVPCRPSLRAQRPSRLIESAVEAVKVALGFETERDGFQRSADALQEKRESSFATAGRALARIQRDIARKDDVTLTLATSSAPYKEALRRILESVEGEDSRELVTKRLQYHRQEALRDIATADELTASKMRLEKPSARHVKRNGSARMQVGTTKAYR